MFYRRGAKAAELFIFLHIQVKRHTFILRGYGDPEYNRGGNITESRITLKGPKSGN